MADKNKLLDKENNPHGEINVKFLIPNKDPKDTSGNFWHYRKNGELNGNLKTILEVLKNFLESFCSQEDIWLFLNQKKQQKFQFSTLKC